MILFKLSLEVSSVGMLAHLLQENLVFCDALERLDQVGIQEESITNVLGDRLKRTRNAIIKTKQISTPG